MKRLCVVAAILSIVITGMIALTIGCTKESTTPTQRSKDMTAKETFGLIQENRNNLDFIIVDVRTPSEYAEGHIENAINIDYNAPAFREDIGKLDRAKSYLVYCRSGNRSRGAIDVMKELNFQEVYHMYEGIIGWTNAGYPTVK